MEQLVSIKYVRRPRTLEHTAENGIFPFLVMLRSRMATSGLVVW